MLNTNTADWRRFCLQIITAQIGLTTQERQSQVLPSDNNSPNRTDYTREAEPGEKKRRKVLPSDNNSPNRTDYPRETKPGEKKGRFCLQISSKPNTSLSLAN